MKKSHDFKQNAVSQSVWPWTETDRQESGKGPRTTGRKACVQSVIMCAVATLLYFVLGHKIMSAVVFGLALVVLFSGVFVPPVFEAIDHFGQSLGRLVTGALTWLLLVPFFYLCFVPGRLLHRLRGTDPLKRKCPSDETTYWNEHRKQVTPDSIRKQY